MVNVKQFFNDAKVRVRNARYKHTLKIIRKDVSRTKENIVNSNLSDRDKKIAKKESLKVNKLIRNKNKQLIQ